MKALLAIVLVGCGAKPAPVGGPTKPLEHHDVESPAAIVDWNKLVGPIRSVEVTGSDSALVAKARAALEHEVGQPIDRARLRNELAVVFASQGASDVTTRGVQMADGIKLVVDVAPQPNLHALTARDGVGDVKLPSQLVAALGLPLDPVLVQATAQNLRDSYLERGFLDASVDWKVTPSGAGAVDVVIEIVPGKAVTIDRVELTGAAHAKRAELDKAIGPELAAGKPWQTDRVERAALLVQAFYYDRGYVNVRVETPPPQGEKATLSFVIREGAQFHVRKLAISGVPPEQAKKYEKLIQIKPGEVFNRTAVIAAIKRIQDAAVADGIANATVNPLTQLDADKNVIDMTFEIAK